MDLDVIGMAALFRGLLPHSGSHTTTMSRRMRPSLLEPGILRRVDLDRLQESFAQAGYRRGNVPGAAEDKPGGKVQSKRHESQLMKTTCRDAIMRHSSLRWTHPARRLIKAATFGRKACDIGPPSSAHLRRNVRSTAAARIAGSLAGYGVLA